MNVSRTILFLSAAILLLYSNLSCLAADLRYSEIENRNTSCFPKDTCSTPRDLDDIDNHNCDCSSLCLLHDTCCIDSPFLNLTSLNTPSRSTSCVSASQSEGSFFMIDVCPPSYGGPIETRHVCERERDWKDPIANVPVTNMASQRTYKSIFCAICNGESSGNLTMWQITVDCANLNDNRRLCSRKKNFVINNMIFDEVKAMWGVWSWDSKTDWQFRPLAIGYRRPPSLSDSVIQCRPNLISDCDASWDDSLTLRMCKSYMAALYFPGHAYRNIHCAICNYVTNMTDMSCHDLTSSPFRSMISMSFGLLLDIDLSDGSRVGKLDSSCPGDQVYDPFAKKCRSVVCAVPGHTLQGNKCVKISDG